MRSLPVLPHNLRLRFHQRKLENVCDLINQDWIELHRYSNRFLIQAREGRISFVDRFWPTTVTFEDPQLDSWDAGSLRDAFLWGFVGPVLEWKAQQFSTEKLFAEQLNFWQYPCRTEQQAYERHLQLQIPYWDAEGAHVYVGLPWATWIDRKHIPQTRLRAFRERLLAAAQVLTEWGIELHVHTVCQHIKWQQWGNLFRAANISRLWLSHKQIGCDAHGEIALHSWPLFAVNIFDPSRSQGLRSVDLAQKAYLASFKGAYMPHYISQIRLALKNLHGLNGFFIDINDEWHFNPLVYGHQVLGNPMPSPAEMNESVIQYNELLVASTFCLCPSGAGPNTLRLWEALGAGVIPVILSDSFEPPLIFDADGAPVNWDDAVLFHAESEWSSLPSRLTSIDRCELLNRLASCQYLFNASQQKTCFGSLSI